MLMYERTEAVDALIMEFARQCQAGGAGAGALDESSAASAG
jgi:hypothetical protein